MRELSGQWTNDEINEATFIRQFQTTRTKSYMYFIPVSKLYIKFNKAWKAQSKIDNKSYKTTAEKLF
jgi:hypothetical protein